MRGSTMHVAAHDHRLLFAEELQIPLRAQKRESRFRGIEIVKGSVVSHVQSVFFLIEVTPYGAVSSFQALYLYYFPTKTACRLKPKRSLAKRIGSTQSCRIGELVRLTGLKVAKNNGWDNPTFNLALSDTH